MDDLLKVFFWETSECIAACWLAVDRLRQVPDDADSFEDMLEQFRTMRETSRFLGMSALQAAAGAVLESLEMARANRPESMERMVSLAVDGLKRIEAVVKGMMIADAAMTDEVPMVRPAVVSGGELASNNAASRLASGPRSRTSSAAARKGDSPKSAAAKEKPVVGAEAAGSLATAAAPVAPAETAESATGTVRVELQVISQLAAAVDRLAATQDQILRLLADRTVNRPAPVEQPAAAAPARAETPEGRDPPAIAAVAPPAPVRVETVGHLLFRAGDGSRRAVRQDRVEGVEELELKAVDNDRGLWVTRWNGSPLPLIPVDPNYQLAADGRSSVIIFRIGGQRFGLLIGDLPEPSDVQSAAVDAGGGFVDQAGDRVEVIDPTAYFEQFIRGRFQRRRRKPARTLHAADSARAAIPADDDLFVRKTGR